MIWRAVVTKAISDTSPLLYLYRIGVLEWLSRLLALENPERVVLLDDALARRVAQAAGLEVWGTLRVLLEAKSQGLTESIGPLVHRLRDSGMWISDSVHQRVLALASEKPE